ncbi:MAG: SRPBCC domain-containing protein [Myxococcales bacterium]|nr:SRPBCC domain-containing protein [Myxococcales bacterium]
MGTDQLRVWVTIPQSPNRLYSIWLDERKHSVLVGSRMTVEPWVGGRYASSDGGVVGRFVGLDTGRHIYMTWRSTKFPPTAPDSRVAIAFEPVAGGTRLVVRHTGLPPALVAPTRAHWKAAYLDPMRRYFTSPQSPDGALRQVWLRHASVSSAGTVPAASGSHPGPATPPAAPTKPASAVASPTATVDETEWARPRRAAPGSTGRVRGGASGRRIHARPRKARTGTRTAAVATAPRRSEARRAAPNAKAARRQAASSRRMVTARSQRTRVAPKQVRGASSTRRSRSSRKKRGRN